MTGRLAGKVAVVTGGASGIGLASARRFVADGARVVVGDIDRAALEAVAAELGDAAATVVCDVTVEDDRPRRRLTRRAPRRDRSGRGGCGRADQHPPRHRTSAV